ncbi:MAG: hypothetical protein MZV63_47000 [Marinilabiliales bacterium]|nr:hypothetical protein [Marinilabiliales bacterium]
MPQLPDSGDRIGQRDEGLGRQAFLLDQPLRKRKDPLLDGRTRIFLVPRSEHGFAGSRQVQAGPRLLPGADREELSLRHGPSPLYDGGRQRPPDPRLPDFVKDWNERYVSPRFRIATASEMFVEFEKRHGAKLPMVRGDFSVYWEDGAASTAREQALNREAAAA